MLLKTDDLGIPRFSNRDLIDMIYSGNVEKCHVVLCDQNDDVDKFNTAMEAQGLSPLQKYIPLDVDKKTFDGVCQGEWFMPAEYKALSVYNYIMVRCETQEEKDRCMEELEARRAAARLKQEQDQGDNPLDDLINVS